MAERGKHTQALALRTAARGNGHTVEGGLLTIGKGKMERLVGVHGEQRKAMARLLPHTKLRGEAHQAIDDAVRVLRHGKHTLVVLRGERHSLALKPLVGMAMVEPLKKALHQLVATRIGVLGVAYLPKRVGEVAASAASNLHLGQHLMVFLKYGNVGQRLLTLGRYSGEVASRSTTDYGDTKRLMGHANSIRSNAYRADYF